MKERKVDEFQDAVGRLLAEMPKNLITPVMARGRLEFGFRGSFGRIS